MPLTDSLRDDILASVPSLRAFAISLSGNGDRADDLVQETLLRAIANINSFQPGSNLPAWLFTILRNLFRSDYRKRRREVEDAEGNYAKTLKTQPRAKRASGVRGVSRRARQAAAGPARSVDPGRRLRLLLRGRRRHLRLRGRHHQEPRQPRTLETERPALCRRRRGFRPRRYGARRDRRQRRLMTPSKRHGKAARSGRLFVSRSPDGATGRVSVQSAKGVDQNGIGRHAEQPQQQVTSHAELRRSLAVRNNAGSVEPYCTGRTGAVICSVRSRSVMSTTVSIGAVSS